MKYYKLMWTVLTIINVLMARGIFLRRKQKQEEDMDMRPVNAVLNTLTKNYSVLVISEQSSQGRDLFTELSLGSPRDLGLFDVVMDGRDFNTTRLWPRAIRHALQVRQSSWNVLVLVVSDDPSFLTAFASWSLRARLLVWSTRLLVCTGHPLHGLQQLHKVLSLTNSLLLVPEYTRQMEGVQMFSVVPFSEPRDKPNLVASWIPSKGLIFTPHGTLFPEKFLKFHSRTEVSVTMTEDATHEAVMEEDPATPAHQQLVFKGYMVTVLDFVARGLNFSYTFKKSPDGTYGVRSKDGTWSGMVGQVYREEVDLGLGPFTLTEERAGSVDYTWPVKVISVRILAGQGQLKVDPWSFLLPLAPQVWLVILTYLLFVPNIVFLLSYLVRHAEFKPNEWIRQHLDFISMVLQESAELRSSGWLWQRVVVGVWLLMTLVLTKSYEGNLMSQLAVRHVPQPYQSLRDVLDDPATTMIWQKGSSHLELIRTAKSGIFREVNEAGQKGRIRQLRVKDYLSIVEEDVINGHHVIIGFETNIMPVRGQHFSLTGRCNFYIGRERVISQSLGMIGSKTNPLVHFMSKWIMHVNEAGLHDHWYTQAIPNSSMCVRLPSKVTVSTSFSINNSWAMFVVLLIGLGVGFLALLAEFISAHIL